MTIDPARSTAGFRHCIIYQVEDVGALVNVFKIPTSGSDAAYEGYWVSGVKSLTLTDPPSRQILHTGDDGIVATMTMPPNTAPGGTLTAAKIDDSLEAILTDSIAETLGDGQLFPIGPSNKGDENYVIMLAYAQAVNTTKGSASYGKVGWDARLIPLVRLVPQDTGYADAPAVKTYQLFPQIVTQYPWGQTYTNVVNGFTTAFAHRLWTLGRPRFAMFRGNNSRVAFTFNTDYPARNTTSITVYVDGSKVTTGITKAVSGVTWDTAPTANQHIVIFYETDYE